MGQENKVEQFNRCRQIGWFIGCNFDVNNNRMGRWESGGRVGGEDCSHVGLEADGMDIVGERKDQRNRD